MRNARWLALLMTGWMFSPGVAVAQQSSAAQEALDRFSEALEARRAELVEVRRDIHRNPEISGEEERTAGIVAERLRAAGYEVRTGIGGHGVIGVLQGGRSGPVLAFRADMDAVRSPAPDPVEFASKVPGVRHICGHDIHTTVGLALAEGLSAIRDELAGSVMMIFQPAEEAATGARAMLADGAFDATRPDALFAYHTSPMEVGQVAVSRGVQLPGRDAVRIDVRGEGDLRAAAEAARDLLRGVATVEDAFTSTADPFVLAQGVVANQDRGGQWRAIATLTTSSVEESERARQRIAAGIEAIERGGLDLTLVYQARWIAGVTNDADLVDAANVTARAVLGETAVLDLQTMAPAFSEDFGAFQEEVPGAMYFLGVSNSARGWVGMPHTAEYVADEEAIFIGARTMGAVFLDLFENGLPSSR